MSGYLPYGDFKWIKNVHNFDVNSISENSSTGYILNIDLEYPDELHVLHNDYPLAPEKLAIPYDMLSDYCKTIADKYEIKVGNEKKLIPNLGDFVLHYKNLQLYLSWGMKLTNFHKVLQFNQSNWFKNISILTLKKEQTLLTVLKKTFFSLWLIVYKAKQWEI